MKERTPENRAHWESDYQRRVSDLSDGLRKLVRKVGEEICKGSSSSSLHLLTERLLPHPSRILPRIVATQFQVNAAVGVAWMLDQMPVHHLSALDRAMRRGDSRQRLSWGSLRGVEGLVVVEERPSAILGLASFHKNGQIREAATRKLALNRDGGELAFLILRLNDWVPSIRVLAEAAVLERAVLANVDSLVACAPLILRLKTLERTDHGRVLQALLSVLLDPRAVSLLVKNLDAAGTQARAQSLRMLDDAGDALPWKGVLSLAAVSPDLVVRRWAARRCAKRLSETEARELLEPLAEDKHVSVRVVALRGLVELLGEGMSDRLRAALFDRGPSVRVLARFHLRNMGLQTDFAASYREVLVRSRGTRARIAAAGLGETGTEADVLLIAPMLKSSNGQDVMVALRALDRMSDQSTRSRQLDLLVDNRLAVRWVASRLLSQSAAVSDYDDLRRVIESGAPEREMESVLSVVRCCLSGWPELRLLLLLAKRPQSPGLIERLMEALPITSFYWDSLASALVKWCEEFEHGLYAPRPATAIELEDSEQLFARASGRLPSVVRERLAGILNQERAQA